jgi:hypothetical protein
MQGIADLRRTADEVRPVKKMTWPCAASSVRERTDEISDTGSWAGVRASIVAMKPGNSGGAKGCRKVDA